MVEKPPSKGWNAENSAEGLNPEPQPSLFVAALEGSLILAGTSRDLGMIERAAGTFCQMLR